MKISELTGLITTEFIQELYRADLAEAEIVRAAGCPYCGGRLHSASYPRKARGLSVELPEVERRQSFCCAECRRRSTPKSVRFWGRKVYLALCLVVAGVLRGQKATTAQTCSLIAMSAETLRRWTRWWTDSVQRTRWWHAARAHIMPPLEGGHFVGALLYRLLAQYAEVRSAIQKLLTFISPLTVPAQYPS